MTARARTPALALSTISASTSRIELMRIIWALAWPAIMTFGLESLVGLIDTLMVGRLGANAVAGVGVGSQILNAVSVMNMALATGTVALVARHVGAAQRHEAGAVVTQSIYLALAMGLAIAVPMSIYAPHLVAIFKVEPEVLENGAGFVRIIMLGVPCMATCAVIAAGLRGSGDMRTPLAIGALVNVINVCVGYTLIFGHFGMPALGVRGSAVGSATAFTIGAGLGLAALLRRNGSLRLERDRLRPSLTLARRILAVGSPTGIEQLLMQIGFLLYLGIAARYQTDRDPDYAVLAEPDGPFYFAGEHLSHVGAWQEGAMLSARRAINMMDKHRRARHA